MAPFKGSLPARVGPEGTVSIERPVTHRCLEASAMSAHFSLIEFASFMTNTHALLGEKSFFLAFFFHWLQFKESVIMMIIVMI